MSLFKKTEAYLGIDIGAHGIKLVELHKTKGRPQLWTYGIAEEDLDIHLPESHTKSPEEILIEENSVFLNSENGKKKKKAKELPQLDDPRIDKYAKLLKELLRRSKVTTNMATASLPVSYIFHTVLNLPKVEDKEIEAIVKAEVTKMSPRPIEDMQIVHQKIPNEDEKAKTISILVTAAPKILVQFYTLIFQKAGLQLQELETEAFALERSLVGRDKATAMVVDIGAERTNFFIIDKGLPITHRSVSEGGNTIDTILAKALGVEKDLASQIKTDLSKMQKVPSEVFMPLIDIITKEIEYSFDLFLSQTGNEGKKPEKIVLTGGASVMPFFKEEIEKKFPLKVFVGDPWARTVYQDGLKQILDGLGPRMAVSIGLAMRNIVK
ncbi:MAG: pilus assembly protein PilM [Candidatus Magasanikbacteria bacterium]|jgi:type IV pilus assembly protein PilM|nr:pilus assembly protein PilM [Candidatus Magasanikbacteria bacterium]MBT4314896.1 pilus assembly protein PilM [Candidatus Magasanikbacteria bacterium]MBT4546852.1 pilus assembly protein PilM [Candidatus Magasanikbacteria bacterium]MBT6819275.1 pilus assembly protein PilM [Candidatus Magasanikbacteria bacterium]